MLSKLKKIGLKPKDEWFDFELYVAGRERLSGKEEAKKVAEAARAAWEAEKSRLGHE